MFEKKTISEVTVWNEIYVGSNYREFRSKTPAKIYSFFYIAELQWLQTV